MGKPSQPTPPDPKETSAAQTGTNVSTSIANNIMRAMNQVGPTGSLTYYAQGQNGQLMPLNQWRDPNMDRAPPQPESDWKAPPPPYATVAPQALGRRPRS